MTHQQGSQSLFPDNEKRIILRHFFLRQLKMCIRNLCVRLSPGAPCIARPVEVHSLQYVLQLLRWLELNEEGYEPKKEFHLEVLD